MSDEKEYWLTIYGRPFRVTKELFESTLIAQGIEYIYNELTKSYAQMIMTDIEHEIMKSHNQPVMKTFYTGKKGRKRK